jgi:hypothetical protein
MLRAIVESWHARLSGRGFFDVRRVHEREPQVVERFAALFPQPTSVSLKRALRSVLELHEEQRAQLDLEWRTSPEAREQIRRWVDEL